MLNPPANDFRLALNEIAAGGSLAEEVISTIRTSQAFGTQRTLAVVYDTFASRATALENNIAIGRGFGVGAMFFILYACEYLERSCPVSTP